LPCMDLPASCISPPIQSAKVEAVYCMTVRRKMMDSPLEHLPYKNVMLQKGSSQALMGRLVQKQLTSFTLNGSKSTIENYETSIQLYPLPGTDRRVGTGPDRGGLQPGAHPDRRRERYGSQNHSRQSHGQRNRSPA